MISVAAVATRACLLSLALGTLVASGAAMAADLIDDSTDRQWRFRVLLDGKDIGFHQYDVKQVGERRVVRTRAEFDVKFLFFNAYKYRHSLKATWQGSCLEDLQSETNANGKAMAVTGQRRDRAFAVESGDKETDLPSCVMNFAYWDPRILEQEKLLNPQTGEYLDVEVSQLGEERVPIDGREVAANVYRIVAKDMQIDLWYSQDENRWIALESQTKGARVIRYERENFDV